MFARYIPAIVVLESRIIGVQACTEDVESTACRRRVNLSLLVQGRKGVPDVRGHDDVVERRHNCLLHCSLWMQRKLIESAVHIGTSGIVAVLEESVCVEKCTLVIDCRALTDLSELLKVNFVPWRYNVVSSIGHH